MKHTILTAVAATALALSAGPTLAGEDDSYRKKGMDQGMMQGGQGMMQGGQGMGPGMMQGRQGMMQGRQGMMQGRSGMGMRRGMMGHGMGGMMNPMMMMKMVFILSDTDGNGALSLEEVLAVEERFFHAMDADDDGQLTPEEMAGFMRSMMMMPGMKREDESED